MAEILATRHQTEVFPQHSWATFEWEGSKYEPAWIDLRVFNCNKEEFPWPLAVIETIDWDRSALVMRKDVGWNLWWRLVKAKKILGHKFIGIKAKIVLTAMVWGLANWPEGTVVSWKYMFKKPQRRWK
jgi:hypothetical protein